MLDADDNKIKSHQSDEILIIIESFRAMQKQMDELRRTIENEMQRFNKTIEHQMNSLHGKLEDSDQKIEEVGDLSNQLYTVRLSLTFAFQAVMHTSSQSKFPKNHMEHFSVFSQVKNVTCDILKSKFLTG